MSIRQHIRVSIKVVAFTCLASLIGCATRILPPTDLTAPDPIEDNTGKYLCPYTSDGTVAEWVDKGLAARLGSSVGGYAGKKAGEKALESVPFVGGWLGRKAGETAGRKIAIEICGGWDAMRAFTDLSFNEKETLAVWMYVMHSHEENYNDVLKLVQDIYPELKEGYTKALQKASAR